MLQNYLKLALRSLRNNRMYALLNIVGLGGSIACCILIFLLVRQHLDFDTFHEKAGRIGMLGVEEKNDRVDYMRFVPYPMADALRQEYSFLEKTAMVSRRSETLVTIAAEGAAPAKFKEKAVRAIVQPDFFDIFDFPLAQGDLAGLKEPNTAVLTEKYARKYFGTGDAIGKTFNVNTLVDFRVVGILKDIPPNTDLPYQIYCSWATLTSDSSYTDMLKSWGGIHGGTQCFALLREGHSIGELEAALPAFGQKYKHPEVNSFFYHALPLGALHFDPDYGVGTKRSYLGILSLIGLFLLVTACVNFVNMATAKALRRAREVGVRKSLGSTRPQLFWQFMAETGLIAFFALACGLLLARLSLPRLNDLIDTQLSIQFGRDAALYGFLTLLTLLVVGMAGAYPGIVQSSFNPALSLKGTPEARQAGGFSLRRTLVATQFAISQVLIIGAVVVTAQLDYAKNADWGFRRDAIVTLPLHTNKKAELSTLKQELSAISGVEQVSFCMQPPAAEGNWTTQLQYDNRPEKETFLVNAKFADADFDDVFGLQLAAGRHLQASDTVREFVVNETMVKKLNLANAADILGKKMNVDGRVAQVVGVVRDFHNLSFREQIEPLCIMSSNENYDICAVKLSLQHSKSTMAAVEQSWLKAFPDQYYEYRFMDERVESFYESESGMMQLIRTFAGIAIFIGCLGLYGLTAFMVTRKTKEIGIRKTLGATVGNVLWLFGKEYVRLLLIAFLVAAPVGWWAMNAWLQEFAYRIPLGLSIFVVSLAATFFVAVLTVSVQSLKAALANPVKSLRTE